MSYVTVNKLCIRYGKFEAVHDLSFEIPQGEVFGFIGPNGAGKSSTIKVLATLLRPHSGYATINKINVIKYPDVVRRKIGYVPDFFGVYEDLTVNEYLHFFAAAYHMPRNKRQQTVNDVLELTDLTGKIDSQVDALSRGMKQRLGVARVLLHDPAVLLLDEPASGLDPRARIEMRELLKELRNMGKTILISSHILSELSELCTRIGIIEQGKLIAEGSLNDIYRQLDMQRLIHVRISNLDDEILSAVEAIRGVKSVNEDIDRLSIEIRQDELSVEDLHDQIHQIGARITMFQPEAMDMESAFMKLTHGKVQ